MYNKLLIHVASLYNIMALKRQLFKYGNSLVVALDPAICSEILGWERGHEVETVYDGENKTVTVREVQKQ